MNTMTRNCLSLCALITVACSGRIDTTDQLSAVGGSPSSIDLATGGTSPAETGSTNHEEVPAAGGSLSAGTGGLFSVGGTTSVGGASANGGMITSGGCQGTGGSSVTGGGSGIGGSHAVGGSYGAGGSTNGVIGGTSQTTTGGASPCGSTLSLCGQFCVDLSSDSSNCGSCGKACAADQFCSAGSC